MAEAMKGAPERWAIVETFGHRRTAGRISEVELAGARLLRVEIPARRVVNTLVEPAELLDQGWAGEQQYGGAAIYCLTPCSEEQARQVIERSFTTPLPMLEAGATSPSPAHEVDDVDDVDLDEEDAIG